MATKLCPAQRIILTRRQHLRLPQSNLSRRTFLLPLPLLLLPGRKIAENGQTDRGPGKQSFFSLFSSSLLFPFSSPSTTLLSPLLLLLFFLSKSEPDCSLDNRLQGPSCREGDPRKLRPAYDFLDFLRVQPLAIHLVVSYAKFQSSPGPFVGVILPVSRLFLRLRLSTLFLRRVNSDPAHAARRRVILDAAVSRPVLFGSG